MLSVSKPSTNRIDIALSGAIDAEAMQSALDSLIEKSQDISRGKMLYTISDFEMPTLGALAVEFRLMPKLLSLINRFDKCAVLSDSAWIRTAAEAEGRLFPSLSIKSFELNDLRAANMWLDADIEGDDAEEQSENVPV